MPHVPDAALHEMLKQLPPEQAKRLAHIVSGKITHQVRCLGEDTYVTVDEPVLDEEGEAVRDDEGNAQTQQVQKLVREGCKGEVIAYLYADGIDQNRRPKFRIEPVIRPDGTSKLRAVRRRLDGHFGFQCWCGNDSRIARHEVGAIKYDGKPPTRDGLETIYQRLQKDPADYPEINGVRLVDGFQIERVK